MCVLQMDSGLAARLVAEVLFSSLDGLLNRFLREQVRPPITMPRCMQYTYIVLKRLVLQGRINDAVHIFTDSKLSRDVILEEVE